MENLNIKLIKKIALGISVICSCALYVSTANAHEEAPALETTEISSDNIDEATQNEIDTNVVTKDIQDDNNFIKNYTYQTAQIKPKSKTKKFFTETPAKNATFAAMGAISLALAIALGLGARRGYNKFKAVEGGTTA